MNIYKTQLTKYNIIMKGYIYISIHFNNKHQKVVNHTMEHEFHIIIKY